MPSHLLIIHSVDAVHQVISSYTMIHTTRSNSKTGRTEKIKGCSKLMDKEKVFLNGEGVNWEYYDPGAKAHMNYLFNVVVR